ncbi:MAG: hypothetical protein EB117_17205 [Betaproteobacteria bacterium]|nr:hypothetical protein [Betaproteobacteria bacterium]
MPRLENPSPSLQPLHFKLEFAHYASAPGERAAQCIEHGRGAWRRLATAQALRSVSIEGEGIFTDANSEERARTLAFNGSVNNYQLHFGNGDYLTGSFLIAVYERQGEYHEEDVYALRFESAGAISYVAG